MKTSDFKDQDLNPAGSAMPGEVVNGSETAIRVMKDMHDQAPEGSRARLLYYSAGLANIVGQIAAAIGTEATELIILSSIEALKKRRP